MELRESDRLKARLFAIDMRVQELEYLCRQDLMRVSDLEGRLDDARLAQAVGGEAGDSGTIGPELERTRGSLASHQEMLVSVKKSQWKARVAYTMEQARERIAAKQAESE